MKAASEAMPQLNLNPADLTTEDTESTELKQNCMQRSQTIILYFS
jgi:hypothetical protein